MKTETQQENNEKPDSVEVSRTSKGKFSFKIKVYYNKDKENGKEIIKRTKSIYEDLVKEYENENENENENKNEKQKG